MTLKQSLILMIFIFLLIACSQQREQKDKSVTYSASQAGTANYLDIKVGFFDDAEFKALRKRNHGKILFINTWATWCLPCKEEFPSLVKLAKDYENSDVTIIGISVDYPHEIESKIIPFLKIQQANFPNFVQNFKKPEELIDLFNEKWRGAVPATFIYDKNGHQRTFMLGKRTLKEFKSAIEAIRSES